MDKLAPIKLTQPLWQKRQKKNTEKITFVSGSLYFILPSNEHDHRM